MLATGTILAALTLPVVGWHTWVDWLRVTQEAVTTCKSDANWVHLSRDLPGIPRRWLDFSDATPPEVRRDNVPAAVAGWVLLGSVVGLTVLLALLRREQVRAVTGAPAAFLLLGAWLSGFHFMYYDVLLAALPVFLLFTEPWRYFEPVFLPRGRHHAPPASAGGGAYSELLAALRYPPAVSLFPPGGRHVLVLNCVVPTLVVALLLASGPLDSDALPWDTFCLIALWLWCGWKVWRTPAGEAPPHKAGQPSDTGVPTGPRGSANRG
jgi:hypothetical protein